MSKSIEQKFKKLTDVEHVLLRPGRYIGSVKPHSALTYVVAVQDGADKMVKEQVTWNPGFIKLFDEVISNSVDHSKRPEGKHLDTIKVEIDKQAGTISVWDNGGMPVVKHADYNEYIPTLVLGYLRSGSNFDDTEDTDVTGQNGEGASLTNIFSTKFVIETCDGKKTFKQTFTKNMMEKTKPSIIEMDEAGYTRITYMPDYAHLGTTLEENYSKLVKRVYDIAGCNPMLKIYLNGKRIRIDSFKDYIKLYTSEFEIDETPDWQVALAASDDGFKHVSFVNSTETAQGGTHIDYVIDQVVDKLREFFKTKHKVDVKPAEIKQHIRLFINSRIIKPRYDSQTKENMITEPKEYKTSYKVSEKLITKLLKSTIIERVLIWVEAKARAKEMQDLRDKNKDLDKVNVKRILKLEDANLAGKQPELCYLFIAEGDSASKAVVSGRDAKTMGALALRGKPQNANSVTLKKLLGLDTDKKVETEFSNIMAAMGLKIGVPVKSVKDLRYGHCVITSDADVDGSHIAGLMISNLHKFWPELFTLGVVHRFYTPIIKVWLKGNAKDPLAFDTEEEYDLWLAKPGNEAKVKNFKYYKGLGTSTPEEFEEYLSDLPKHLVKIEVTSQTDGDIINLVFGKEDGSSDRRKVWLDLSVDAINLD
jgi:DNA topoisomerase-2